MEDLTHNAVQCYLLVFGIASRWVVGHGTPRSVMVSLWISMANMPAWFYVAWETRSWGLGILNLVYGVLYVRALLNVRKALNAESCTPGPSA